MSSSRSSKKSTGSRKKRRSANDFAKRCLLASLAICLIGAICYGAYLGVQKAIEIVGSGQDARTPTGEPAVTAAAKPWPLPAGTPEAGLYGTHSEPIEPANRETRRLPLRRRKTDPLVQLTNARIEDWIPPALPNLPPEVAAKLNAARPKPLHPQKVLRVDVTPIEWNTPPDNLEVVHGAFDNTPRGVRLNKGQLAAMKLGQSTTVEIVFANERPNLQIYAVTSDDRYRTVDGTTVSGVNNLAPTGWPLNFKVSNTLFVGTPFAGHMPREWHPDELALLITTGGEAVIIFQ